MAAREAVAGSAADGMVLYRSMAPLIAVAELFHPAPTATHSNLDQIKSSILNALIRPTISKISAGLRSEEL